MARLPVQNEEYTPKESAPSWLVLSQRVAMVTVQPFCGPENLMQFWGSALWMNAWPEALESLAQGCPLGKGVKEQAAQPLTAEREQSFRSPKWCGI